jgi:hypothetical protein
MFEQSLLSVSPLSKQLAAVGAVLLLVTWYAMPFFLDPLAEPPVIYPVVEQNEPCSDWDPIIPADQRKPCIVRSEHDPDPIAEFPKFVQAKHLNPNEGIAAFQPGRSNCASNEARIGTARYFLVVCGTETATHDATSWEHELAHLQAGEGSFRFKFPLKLIYVLPTPFDDFAHQAFNAFFDYAYVHPMEVLGVHGVLWIQLIVGFVGFVAATWPKREALSRGCVEHWRAIFRHG